MATSQKQDIDLGITRFEYGDATRVQRAVLQIDTSKHYNGGLVSGVNVFWIGNGSRSSVISLSSYGTGDYGKRLKVSDRSVKATQKAIDRQHAEVFTADVIEQYTLAAKAHYAGYVAAGVDGMHNTYQGSK